MSFCQTQRYLKSLLAKGLLQQVRINPSRRGDLPFEFKTTGKGQELIRKMQEIKKLQEALTIKQKEVDHISST